MVWSAAETLARGLTARKRVVSFPAAPPVARLGERRAAPPGTRLAEDLASSRNRKGESQDLIKEPHMELHAIGIDLGKTVFHLVGLDSSGNVIVRKRCSRTSC